jgi:hypothetical protein
MKDRITLRAVRGYNYYEAARRGFLERLGRLRATREAGLNDIPAWIVWAVVGVVVAGGIAAAIIVFVHQHLDSLPSDPTY